MATTERIKFTEEQKEAWIKAKALLKSGKTFSRPLHIAMSELRAENGRTHKGPIETLSTNPEKLNQYRQMLIAKSMTERVKEWKEYLKNPGKQKLYIIVRDDLSPAQKAVQAAHCAAQFQKDHPLAPWINGTMIIMQTDPEHSYYKRFLPTPGQRLREDYDPFQDFSRSMLWRSEFSTEWREPDQDNRLTAIALLDSFRNEQIGQYPGIKLI